MAPSLQMLGRRTVASFICLALILVLSAAHPFLFACLAQAPSYVPLGSYLPPDGNTAHVVLASPNSMFNLNVQTWRSSPASYCMAGVSNVKINPNPMLWGANNAQPVQIASTCRLYLSEEGDLLLQHDGNKTAAWRTQTAGMGVSNLTLLDSGNLVLLTEQGSIVWQSFAQSPAFAFYSGMKLTSNMTIFSSVPSSDGISDINVPGSFGMGLSNDSNLVLFTNTNDSFSKFVYWSTSISNTEQVSYITLDTGFIFHDNTSKALGSIPPVINLPSNFSSSVHVAMIDPPSANLLAFYRNNHTWTLFFNSSITICENPTQCGNFAMCNASTGACSCPSGFVQNGRDCELESKNAFPALSCLSSEKIGSYRFDVLNVTVQPQISAVTSQSVKDCRLLCAHSCMCRAALYDPETSSCSLFSKLQTLPVRADSKQLLLLKYSHHKKHILKIILEALCAALAVSLCSACAIAVLYFFRQRKVKSRESAANEDVFFQGVPRLPPKYSYKELEAATEDFSTKLGAGGFGAVYEGVLPSGVKVAVKKLEDRSEQSMVQFRAEVASIGSVSHMNLVTLKGFCYAKEGRLLVYEHMGMGSLDRWLFKKGEVEVKKLGWKRRCKIAMDTAKGLAYLHHECGERIVHCDVKPENILLDEQFDAKVGDFGLAKLVGREQQSFAMTTLKGTRGYLAPEWLQDATITAKSDVYSFGVVLLELISGRRCLDSDYGYLPTLAFRIVSTSTSESSSHSHPKSLPHQPQEAFVKQEMSDDVNPLLASQDVMQPKHTSSSNAYDYTSMKELLDPCLSEDADVTPVSLERMILIGLWCVQPSPATRPAMNVVVQMLEGVVAVPLPPLQTPISQANEFLAYISTTSSSTGQ